MKIIYAIVFTCLTIVRMQAQQSPETIVSTFFEAMSSGDTTTLRSLLHDDVVLQSTAINSVSTSKINDLLNGVVRLPAGSIDEQVYNVSTFVDDGLASVTMDYLFYLDEVFTHCGVNVFTMARAGDSWQIIDIADSRHPQPCAENPADTISNTLDQWHMAASVADADKYFDMMTDDAVYVGTDASEVWSKAAFYQFAKPYFDKGKAWSFTAMDRNVYLHDANTAYFDELLSTWMGPCRGSGVMVLQDGQWMVKHYVLSLTIPNEKIEAVIQQLSID